MDAQSNAGPSVLNAEKRERSRLVEKINPAFPGVRGLRDLWRGWRDYRELWLTVGLYDIRKRYRRSVLGPFWITISLVAFIRLELHLRAARRDRASAHRSGSSRTF